MPGKLGRLFPKEYYGVGGADRLLAELNMRRTARIRRCGNAEAVTVPQKWLKILNWAEGDLLMLRLDKSRGTVTLEKSKYQEKRGGQVSTCGQKSPI